MIDDRLLITLRQRTYLELHDLGLLLARERTRVLFAAAFAGALPCALGCAYLTHARLIGSWLLWVLLIIVLAPLATAPLTAVLGDLMFGIPVSFGSVARRIGRRLPLLLWTTLVIRPLLIAIVPAAPFVLSRLAYADEMILLERVRPRHLFTRGGQLAQGVTGQILARQLAAIALGTLFVFCFYFGLQGLFSTVAGQDIGLRSATPGVLSSRLLYQPLTWIAVEYLGLVRFLTYIDRRVRLEGWDLELRLREAAQSFDHREVGPCRS